MPWGNKTNATQITSLNQTEQFFDEVVGLSPTQLVQIQIRSAGSPGGTDGVDIAVYSTLDDSAEAWDSIPITALQLTDSASGEGVSLTLNGMYRFRVGVASSGATDTHTVNMSYRIGTP